MCRLSDPHCTKISKNFVKSLFTKKIFKKLKFDIIFSKGAESEMKSVIFLEFLSAYVSIGFAFRSRNLVVTKTYFCFLQDDVKITQIKSLG